MNKIVDVLIVEDDFYARGGMELLLRRDWRTRVFREISNPTDLSKALKSLEKQQSKDYVKGIQRHYLVLLDIDIPHDPHWLSETMRVLKKHTPKTKVLFTSMAPDAQVTKLVTEPNFAGYILKDEIRYSLAWAVTFAMNHLVLTPGVHKFLADSLPLSKNTVVMDGRNQFAGLSNRETERARMAFIFSMERHELADEEDLNEDYSYGLVSALFEKIGLNDVLNGQVSVSDYFGDHPAVLTHVDQAIADIKKARGKNKNPSQGRDTGLNLSKMPKIHKKETLAFHLLTLPEIEIIS